MNYWFLPRRVPLPVVHTSLHAFAGGNSSPSLSLAAFSSHYYDYSDCFPFPPLVAEKEKRRDVFDRDEKSLSSRSSPMFIDMARSASQHALPSRRARDPIFSFSIPTFSL